MLEQKRYIRDIHPVTQKSHGPMYSVALLLAALVLLYVLYVSVGSEGDEDASSNSKEAPSGTRYVFDERSPNDQYRVTAAPGQAVVLKHADEGVLWEKELQRPNGVSVSNDGTVVVENWESSHPDLISEFVAFDHQGEKRIEEGYDALVRDSGVADDGSIAWAATAGDTSGSEGGDGNQLFVYDLSEQRRLLEASPPVMEIDRVERTDEAIDVIADGLHCRYRDGEMVDPEGVQWAKEERLLDGAGTPNKVASVAKQRLERASQLSEDQLRSTIEAARDFDGSGSDRMWAKLWRWKGELHHHLGETDQALEDYERALSLDEEVGIAQKVRRLREGAEEH